MDFSEVDRPLKKRRFRLILLNQTYVSSRYYERGIT